VDLGQRSRAAGLRLRLSRRRSRVARGPIIGYWTLSAALLLGMAAADLAETRLDHTYDRGPLAAYSATRRPHGTVTAAGARVLRECAADLVASAPLRPPFHGMPAPYLAYARDPGLGLYAC
jgi:hypothetical protein